LLQQRPQKTQNRSLAEWFGVTCAIVVTRLVRRIARTNGAIDIRPDLRRSHPFEPDAIGSLFMTIMLIAHKTSSSWKTNSPALADPPLQECPRQRGDAPGCN